MEYTETPIHGQVVNSNTRCDTYETNGIYKLVYTDRHTDETIATYWSMPSESLVKFYYRVYKTQQDCK